MSNRTVIVTGGATGIGRAIALRFADEGFNIVINHIFDEEPSELVIEIESKNVRAVSIKGDVSVFADAKTLVGRAKEEFGAIDCLVNNAGITRDGLIIRMSEQDFDSVIAVNLKGAFNTIRHVTPIMLKQRFGSIINISSVVGLMGNAGQANYAASKAGLLGLTKSCARELGSRGITCNAIAPGYIETLMTADLPEEIKKKMLESIPLGRFGTPVDVAEAAYFLAVTSYITGQVINVDGGMAMA